MENNNPQNRFNWVYLAGILLILFLPLLSVPPLFHPAAWGKTIVFRIILSILIFFFVCQALYRKNPSVFEKLKLKPVRLVFGILLLLLLFSLLSTIFSPERSLSFWGNPYRAGGFLNFAFYIIFAVLIFLVLKPRNWKLIWNFSLGIALLVSIFALLQQFKVFKEFLVSYAGRPPATLGSAIFLAIYLSFFVFLSLSFAISEKNRWKKVFFFFSSLLIVFVILLTGTRAVLLGIIAAFLYFILFYPTPRQTRYIKILKIATLILLVSGIAGVYCINKYPEKVFSHPLISNNRALTDLLFRFKLQMFLEDPRFSYWKIATDSLQEKPLLGYGPENFSIAFDKYYDPSLPYVNYGTISQVDRAHGFIFDTAVTIGIPALVTFLSLFGFLFWQLEKLKRRRNISQREPCADNQHNPIILHGIQATFIAYFIGIFFSFDTFDTYLIFFLLVGYCLYLISSSRRDDVAGPQKENHSHILPLTSLLYKGKKVIIFVLFLLLVFFIWPYNLKPLLINKELNWADYYSKNGKCQESIDKIEKVLPSHSFIDNYVLLKYSGVLNDCQNTNPERGKELTQKSIQVLEGAARLRPTYTRTWLLLGAYHNLAVRTDENLGPEEKEELLLQADSHLKRALELNPMGQRIYLERADTYLLWGKYDEAKKIADQCIEINANMGDCWLQKANVNIELGELSEAIENIEKAHQNQANIDSRNTLSQLLKRYMVAIQNPPKEKTLELYQPLVFIYSELIRFEPKNFQYYASLAYVFKTLGEYWKAWQQIEMVIKLSPESKQSVKEFLKTFPREALKTFPNNGEL